MATTQQYIDQLKIDKQNLVSTLNNMGVEASNNETFTSLTPKVGKIVTVPILQDKSITITENGTQTITADEGYNGLNNVTVTTEVPTSGEMPANGIFINEWNENGYPKAIEVKGIALENYMFGVLDASTGSQTPTMAMQLESIKIPDNETKIPNNFCSYQNKITTVNFPEGLVEIGHNAFAGCKNLTLNKLPDAITNIGNYAFSGTNLTLNKLPDAITTIGFHAFSGCKNLTFSKFPDGCQIENINSGTFSGCTNITFKELPETITGISDSAFYGCSNLQLEKLPSNLTFLGDSAFRDCIKITIKKIPDGITSLNKATLFYNCKGLTQLSMKNVQDFSGSSAYSSTFYGCSNIKAVWIGSALSSSAGRYSFYGTSLIKMFIDLPRATVETFTNYKYAFMNNTNKTGIIVCNDDEGFMTQDEFDAIDWSTQ